MSMSSNTCDVDISVLISGRVFHEMMTPWVLMNLSYSGNILRKPKSFPDQYNGALHFVTRKNQKKLRIWTFFMHRYIDLGMMWVFAEYFHCMIISLLFFNIGVTMCFY